MNEPTAHSSATIAAQGLLLAAVRRRRAAAAANSLAKAPIDEDRRAEVSIKLSAQAASAADTATVRVVPLAAAAHEREVLDLNDSQLSGWVCRDALAARIKSRRATTLVALADRCRQPDDGGHEQPPPPPLQRAVGFVLAELSRGELSVVLLAVAPAWRGRGCGRALLASCLARGVEEGAHRASLRVETRNATAIGLYRRFGFVASGNVKHAGDVCTVAMSWELSTLAGEVSSSPEQPSPEPAQGETKPLRPAVVALELCCYRCGARGHTRAQCTDAASAAGKAAWKAFRRERSLRGADGGGRATTSPRPRRDSARIARAWLAGQQPPPAATPSKAGDAHGARRGDDPVALAIARGTKQLQRDLSAAGRAHLEVKTVKTAATPALPPQATPWHHDHAAAARHTQACLGEKRPWPLCAQAGVAQIGAALQRKYHLCDISMATEILD
jgi:ribosomal protein S18 acetylase RimI-like enzyme